MAVANRGIGITDPGRWSDTVQLASDPAGRTIVTTLGSFGHNGALAIDGSYERSVEVALPDGLSGTFYVAVSTGGPFEFLYTGNNSAVSGPVTVALSPSPDLRVSDIAAPIEAVSGDRIDVTWTVKNDGTGTAAGSWLDSVVLRETGSGNVINLGSFRATAPLDPGKFTARTEQFTLPADTEGLFRVEVTTNADRSLYERDATGNDTTLDDQTLRISLLPQPDLQVREVSAPTKVQAGGTAAVDFTVINQGTSATSSRWTDRVVLSLDDKLSGDDLTVASLDNLSSLAPGESYRSRTGSFVVPSRYRGAAFFIVQTDSGNSVGELRHEDNNLFVAPVQVAPLPPADLVASGVVAPAQSLAGSSIEVRYTVTNRGVGATNASDWTDAVWLARDRKRPDPRKGDVLLGRFPHNGTLEVNEGYDQTVTVTLPRGVTGQFFITPQTDAFGGVLEDTLSSNLNPDDPNELDNNNYKARGITVLGEPPPDLVVTAVVPELTGRGGEPFTVRWAVRNEGTNGTGDVAWLDRVYLSDAPALGTPGARQILLGAVLHAGGLGVGQGYTEERTFQLSPAAAGRFVIVETNGRDVFQGAAGANEGPFTTNNVLSSATSVTTTAADLRVTSVQTAPQSFSGEKTTVRWTVENVGSPIWPGTRFWMDDVYLSPDATFLPGRATRLGSFAHAAADFSTQSQEVTLPKGLGGTFYIHVIADPEPRTSPASEANVGSLDFYASRVYEGEGPDEQNLGSASIPVTYREPDLRVTDLRLSTASPHAGETLRVTWTVRNAGNRDTREGSWVDRVYLSRDRSLDDGDTVIGQSGSSSILAAGEPYTASLQVRIPDGIEGAYSILVFTDSNFPELADLPVGRVPEFQGEGNNITAVPLTVLRTLPPDLQVAAVTIPERVTAGQSFALTYRISNAGPGETAPTGFDQFGSPVYQWEDLYYLSRDASLDLQSDRFVGSERHAGRLAPGESYTSTQSLKAPRDLQGAFYVFVITDPARTDRPRGAIFEAGNERNNAAPGPQPILIELPPPADLQVEAVRGSASAEAGEPVHVEWTVANRGANQAGGTWTDTVYLSRDALFDPEDRVIGRLARPKALQPGEHYDAKLDAVLPAATPGQYRFLVRADVFNEVYEGADEGNNRTASADALTVSAPELRLGVPTPAALSAGQERLYQITVGLDQTLVVKLTTEARDASNEVFVRYGEAPTGFQFDAMYQGALMADQTAVVPRTQAGTYFVLVRGQSEPAAGTPVTLLVDLLPFQIDDVLADQGGDARYVTATITGAQFSPQALVKLVRPGFAEYEPVRYRVVDSTRIVALFDLRGAPHGLYDVKVINPGGQTAIVPYRYLVERALEPDAAVGLGGARVIAPGKAEIYGFSLQSLTNVDMPYVHFQYGIPELGTNPEVFGLKYLAFSTNLRGEPRVANVPWADLDAAVDRDGEILAPGYALDLASRGFAGLSFTAHTYPGLNEVVDRELEPLKQALASFYPGLAGSSLLDDPGALDAKFPGIKAALDSAILPLDTKDPCLIAFRFHILASATPLTRDEFIAQQKDEAERLRLRILADPAASRSLVLLAADAGSWTGLYLTALEQAGLLRPEDQAPEVRENPQLVSLMATLAAGIQAGPAGEEIRTTGDLAPFFAQVHAWYGDDPAHTGQRLPPAAEAFDLGLSHRTRTEAFNVFVPFANKLGKCLLGDPGLIGVEPPDLARFFGTAGALGRHATLTGPAAFGDRQFLPLGQPLPYTVQLENAPGAPAAVGEVRVVTELDADLDPRTFRLGDLRLGDLQVHIPAGMGAFQGDFDFRRRKGFILRVSAGLDLQSNIATWLLQAIDPETGEVLQDPARGLLPPNNAQGAGSGFVTWTVLPKPGLATGTVVSAQARVLFNTLPPEDTLRIDQMIDGVAPTTTLTSRPVAAGEADYQVDWSAQDDAAGSGVQSVTVYAAEDGGDFTIWRSRTTETSGVYQGRAGHTYEFLALATDNAGNREAPPSGVLAPDDGGRPNLGVLPAVGETTPPDLGPAPAPSGPATNPLFVEARKGVPGVRPATRVAEFQKVLRPFSARAFATGIGQSHADIGPMAILVLPDRTVLASGGPGRNQLFRFSGEGGDAGTPLATLLEPIFDLALGADGSLWAATGGGPLLQLDPATGAVLGRFGDRITQSLAVQPGTGRIFVSSGGGIEVFDPAARTFRHFSDVRVGNLAFAPDGSLWAAVWPQRGAVVRFDPAARNPRPELELRFDSAVDSLAFGADGTRLEGLLFISNNDSNGGPRNARGSDLVMVDLATLERVSVATGGTRGDIVRTTPDGRLLISQSHQIDVLNPLVAPRVAATNPPPDAFAALPLGSVSVTFDQDLSIEKAESAESYQLTGEASGPVAIQSISYDPASRTAQLIFDALSTDRYTLTVTTAIQSAEGLDLETPYTGRFTTITDLSQFVTFDFSHARLLRREETVSYDVKITNTGTNSLLLPVLLTLTPEQRFTGEPLLIDLSGNVPGGLLRPGESTTGRTVTVRDPGAARVAFDPSVTAATAPNASPVFDSRPVTQATAGQPWVYQAQAHDPDGGTALGYLLYRAPAGMQVDAATGLLTWSPSAASPEIAPVVLQVYDGRGGHATQQFTVQVAGGNRAPELADLPAQIEGQEGEPLEIALAATDPEGDRLVAVADNLPPGAVFEQQVLRWTPGEQAAGTYPGVRFTVSDRVNEVTRTTTLLIAPTNQAPTLLRPADRTVREGETVRLRLVAADPEGDPLTFASDLLPGGAFLDPHTGQFEWTPGFFQHGVFEVPLSVSDGELTTTVTATLTVLNVNAAPVFDDLGRFETREGQPVSFRVRALDPDNPAFVPPERKEDGTLTDLEGSPATVTYRAGGVPAGAAFDPETLVFTWSPGFTAAGSYPLIFTATDDGDGTGTPRSATATVDLEVLDANRPPVLTDIANQSVERGATLDVIVRATDPDGDLLTLKALGLPRFGTFTDRGDGSGLFRFTPGAGDRGNYTLTVRASDEALTVEKGFVLTVSALNEPPRLERIGDKVAVFGQPLTFTITASDPDQEPLTFRADGLPPGATLTPGTVYGTATFAWAPSASDAGVYGITFRVADAREEDRQAIRLVVRETNGAPVLSPPGMVSAAEGQPLTVTLAASDPDGDPLLFAAFNLPPGATLDAAQGVLRWTPNLFQAGSYPGIVVSVTDGQRTAAQSFAIEVASTNQTPVLQPLSPQSGREGAPFQLAFSASDPDGDLLTFGAIAPLPSGARLDARTGKLQWTPDFTQAGDYTLRFEVRDSAGLSAETGVTLRIANVNRPPELQVSNQGAVVGLPLRFAVQASDPDAGTALTYMATGLPEGATLDARGGEVAWTPGPGQAGDYVVTFAVSDGEAVTRKSALLRATAAPEAPRVTIELTPSFPAVPGQSVSIHVIASSVSDIAEITARIDGQNLSLTDGRAVYVPSAPGRSLVEATAKDVNGFVGQTSAVLEVRDPEDVDAPVVSLDSTLTGSVADLDLDTWVLEIARAGSETFSEIARGDAPISGRLANLGDLENGFYRLRLTATDRGGRTSRTETVVEINTSTKPAQYRRSETDLTVSLDGSQLDLVRAHDSLARDQSRSFGFGWRSANRDTDLQTGVPPDEPFRFGTRVYLTLPDGRRAGFTFAPERRELPGLIYYTPAWRGDPGVEHRLDSAPTLLAAGGQRLYDLRTARPYRPETWTLTAPDGTVDRLDGTGTVTQEILPNGTRLFFAGSGIATPAGDTVRFTPDAAGRLAAVTAPDGTTVLYTYDAQGNLTAARNLATAQSQRYGTSEEAAHRLDIVVAPPSGSVVRYGPEPEVLPLTSDLGSAHRFLAAPRLESLASGETDRFAFSLRLSELNATAKGEVILGVAVLASSFRPALPVIPGVTPLLTRSGDRSATALFALRRDGLKLLEVSAAEGSGDYTLELWVPGDVNLDGKVDGRDSELLGQADTDRDGKVDVADLQLLGANFGFAANLPPVATAGQALTHVDLPVRFDLARLATDPEDDPLSFRVIGAEHGTARVNPDGRSATFTPDPGYSGPAAVRFQADDGYEASAPAAVAVTVSAAPLVRLDIKPRAALIGPGQNVKLTATGDFADQKDVDLPAAYLTLASTHPEVAVVTAAGRVRGAGNGATVLVLSRGPVQAATVLNVGDTSDPVLPSIFTGLQVYPAATALASPGGTRQLRVSLDGETDLTAADMSTVYISGRRDLLSVSPDGLMTALAPGDMSVTVISRGQELVLPVHIEAPRSGPTTLRPDGGVVRAANGAVLGVPPGALAADTAVRFEPLDAGDLPAPLPLPFTYVAGFHLEVGETAARQPLQLAVPVPAGTPVGSRVYFFRYGSVPDETGRERLSLFQDDTGVVGPDGIARTASPPWPGILKSGDYAVATADPSLVTELQVDIDLARPVEESDLEGLIVAAPVAAPPALAAPLAGSFAGTPESGLLGNQVIELITVPTDLGPISVGVAVVTFAGVPLPGTIHLHLAYVVPKTVQNIEMIQIRQAGLPVVTTAGVQIDPGAVTQVTVNVINDRPPISDVRFAPQIDSARLLIASPEGGKPQPILSLTGDRFLTGIRPENLVIYFQQGGRDDVVTDPGDGSRTVRAVVGAKDVEVLGSAPGVEFLQDNHEVRIPVPPGVTVGLSAVSAIRIERGPSKLFGLLPGDFMEVESNQTRLVQQKNYLFASLGIDQVAVVDAQATLPPATPNGSPLPNPDFNKLVARIAVGDPKTFNSPRAVAVTGDGTRAYVSLANNPGIAVVDALALQQVEPIPLPNAKGARPFWVVADDLNQRIYVSDEIGYPVNGKYEGRIYVLDTNPSSDTYHKKIEAIAVQGNAQYGLRGMALSSDGRRLYVAIAGAEPRGILGGIVGSNGQIAIFDTDLEDRKREEQNPALKPKRFLTQIGLVDTSIPGETYGITATNNPLRMIFTNRLIDFVGMGLLEEDPSGPSWSIRRSINLTLGFPGSSFDVNNARAVAVSPDLSYAFVTGFNRYIKDQPDHDPYVRPRNPAGGNIGIIRDPFRLFLGPGSGTLVAATRTIPWSFPDNLVLSVDGHTLWAGYYGTHAIFAFDVDQIKNTVESRVINARNGLPLALDDLQNTPIDDLNGLIDLKADYRRDGTDGVFKIPFDNPPGSNPRGPIASGGLPQGLAVQSDFLRLLAPLDVESSLTPTFRWDFSGVEVAKVSLYVSVFPAGEGLLPGDRFFKFPDPDLAKRGITADLLAVNGDFNPNRIVTKTWNSPQFGHALPATHTLTAGQTYYWAVEAISTTGQRNIKFGKFQTAPVQAANPEAFSSVTIITHGFDLPSLTKAAGAEQTVGKKFFQLGAQIARAGSLGPLNEPGGGLMMLYTREGGKWIPVDQNGLPYHETDAHAENFKGRPLVLINNWIQESFISESGFSEAAADAFFAALVQLDQDTRGMVFKSPIHLIGQSRGTVVTSELAQRIGTYQTDAKRPPDVHMTLIDPHDFKQDSLNVRIDYLLSGLEYLGNLLFKDPTYFGAIGRVLTKLPSSVADATGNDRLWYGNFFEPKIQIWDNVDFADSYFQTVPVNDACEPPLKIAGCLTITPGGRDIPNTPTELDLRFPDGGVPDIRGFMGSPVGDPDRSHSRAGFTKDNDLPLFGPFGYGAGRVHLRVFPWYAGTTDLSVRRFSLRDADPKFYQEDIFRRRSDLRYERLFDKDFYGQQTPPRPELPWYTPDHRVAQQVFTHGMGAPSSIGDPDAPWEGIGTGWFHSVLGGGRSLRPTPTSDRIPVTFDNSAAGLSEDLPVPSIFNGNFDAGLRPFKKRFPVLFYEIPGWSYQNSDTAEIPTFNFDSLLLVDRCQDKDAPSNAPQCSQTSTPTDEKKATDFALELGVRPKLDTDDVLHIVQDAIQAAFGDSSSKDQAKAQDAAEALKVLKLAGYDKVSIPFTSPLTQITHNRMYVPEWAEYLRLDAKITKESGDDILQVIFRKAPFNEDNKGVTQFFAVKEITNGWMTHYVKVPDGFAGETATVTLRLCNTDLAEQTDPKDACSGVDSEVLVDNVFFATLVPFDDDPPGDADGNGDQDNQDGVVLFFERDASSGSSESAPSAGGVSESASLPSTTIAPNTVVRIGDKHTLIYKGSRAFAQTVRVTVQRNDFLVLVRSVNGQDVEEPLNDNEVHVLRNGNGSEEFSIPAGGELALRFKAVLHPDYLDRHREEELLALLAVVDVTQVKRSLFGIPLRLFGFPKPSTVSYNLVFLRDNADDDSADNVFKLNNTLENTKRILNVANHAGVQARFYPDPNNPPEGASGKFDIGDDKGRLTKFIYKAESYQPNEENRPNSLSTAVMLTFNGIELFARDLREVPRLHAYTVPRQTINIPAGNIADEALNLLTRCRELDPANCTEVNNLYGSLPQIAVDGVKALGYEDARAQITDGMREALEELYRDVRGENPGSAGDPGLTMTFDDVVVKPEDITSPPDADNLPTRVVDIKVAEGIFRVIVDVASPRTVPNPPEAFILGSAPLDFDDVYFRTKLFVVTTRRFSADPDARMVKPSLSRASRRFIVDKAANDVRNIYPDSIENIAENVVNLYVGRLLRFGDKVFSRPTTDPKAKPVMGEKSLKGLGYALGNLVGHEIAHIFGLLDEDCNDYAPPVRSAMSERDPTANNSFTEQQKQVLLLAFDNPEREVPLDDKIDRLIEYLENVEHHVFYGCPPSGGVTPASALKEEGISIRLSAVEGLTNPAFLVTDPTAPQFGWETRGAVSVQEGSAVLQEDDRVLTRLAQTFTVPEGAKTLRFTIVGANLTARDPLQPPDAFEVALLDASTLASLVGTAAGLSNTDSFLNLQPNGEVYAAPKVALPGTPLRFPLTVEVDLRGLAAGTRATLSFDLLGFSPTGSSVAIDNVFVMREGASAPVVAAGGSYSGLIGQPVSFDGSGSTDPDSPIILYEWDFEGDGVFDVSSGSPTATHAYPAAGTYTATLRVTDDTGLTSTGTASVVIRPPNRPPTAILQGPSAVNAGQSVTFSGTGSFDPDGDVLIYAWSFGDGSSGSGPSVTHVYAGQGTFTVALTVTDPAGLSDTKTSQVTVSNAAPRPPVCTGAKPSTNRLWPPNHKYVTIQVLGVTGAVIDRIRQDEPVNGTGDGDTAPDGEGIGTATAQVRAERAGTGNGRVYHIYFTAKDARGGACTGDLVVGVPHDQGQSSVPVDDGPLFDSTKAQ
ncbi:MAG TPA: putative Ig domain-containing protein [Thermoanaerobaculia bacterium]|nr:putative Ig domain-containing protein [Thermoanaerobaculia bacterium]